MASETVKKITSNTAYQLVGKIVTMSVTILATIIITRIYGRDGYGAFNLMQTFPALFFIIVDFGINAVAVKELSLNPEKEEDYLSAVLILRLVLSFLVILAAGISLIFFPYTTALKTGIYMSLLLVLTQALFTSTNIIFQLRLRYDLSTIGQISGSILIFFLILGLARVRADVRWVSFSYVIGGIVAFVINSFFLGKLGVYLKFSYNKALLKFLILQSLPLGLMFIFSQVNFKVDSILISIMKLPANIGLSNTESVAVYGLPYKIFEVSLVIPTFFMNSVYPVLVRHMLEGREKLQKTFLRSISALASVGVFVGLMGILFAPLIIDILGGPSFARSVTVLRILLGGLIVFYLTQPIAWLIVTLGGQKYLPYIYLVSAIFNVTTNLVFIPRFSFYGSSVITILSELLILIMLAFTALRVWKNKYA